MKEQTVRAPADVGALGEAWAVRDVLRKAVVPVLFFVLALLVTVGYGSGVQLNDGQAALHIDPLKFLWQLVHAWNPALHLGEHTGYWYPYESPYGWAYGVAQALRIPQDYAQHAIVFAVYLACLFSMHYCLRYVTPWLDEVSRVAGSCAYLFNMYVALNSQAQIVWLLTYATLPAMVGVTARALRGEINLWRAGLFIALLVLVGGGMNPPLVAINAIILAIFVAVTIVFDPAPLRAARRAWPFVAVTAAATVAINLYWLVPFVDFFRSVYLNGVLSETPSMHNAATSFDNVLRGLGHWATFVSFAGRAYFPWAASYAAGIFGALLWFVPIVALGGIAFKRNQRPATLFFLIVTIVSVPLVVGYYHDALGDAVTEPIYNVFYRNFPGFQMFRFSYKWVAGVEFGIGALYAISVSAILAWLREHFSDAPSVRRWNWLAPAAAAAAIVIPIVAFVPVLINKMNYAGPVIPPWEYREKSLVGDDPSHRVALFPTQYLEQFDWGSPQFYIEDSFVDRPMIYGLLGGEPAEGTDVWVRRSYRAAREGLPFAGDMLRVLGVDTILQRDDFIPAIDFSSPGEWRFNTTTLTHDLLHRVVGATPVRSEGPLRVYHLSGALPLVYGVTHPIVSTLPKYSDGYLGDVDAMASGKAVFEPPSRSADEFSSVLTELSPILPASSAQIRDLAVNEVIAHAGIRIHPPPADVGWTTPFTVRSAGVYEIFAMEESLLYAAPPAQNLGIDGSYFSPQTADGAWTEYGQIDLPSGGHFVTDGYPDPNLVVALVSVDDLRAWQDRIAALGRTLPHNRATTSLVYGHKTTVTLPASGKYRITAGAVAPFGPDGQARARLASGGAYRGAFPANLSGTLPYVFGRGVVGTTALMMPPAWYRDDPTAYQWQRGDPTSWFLFAREAHVRVFVPGSQGVDANVAMRVGRLQVSGDMSVAVDGGAQQAVTLAGSAAASQAYDSATSLGGPAAALATFRLTLHPGWNDVAFRFHSGNGEREDLGSGEISAAVAPDLSFSVAHALRASAQRVTDSAFSAFRVADPPDALSGDPELTGTIENMGGRAVWLAVALSNGGRYAYRVYPVPQNGVFDVNFMHAFPDDWDDASQRVAGIWFLTRGAHPNFSSIYYTVHAIPERALRRPQSLASLPIRIDGRPLGAQPVSLSAGRHVVASGDKQVKITLLSIDPVDLPRTNSFGLQWNRRSPTMLDVTARKTANPFLLVFGEAFHPEWQATLNGSEPLPHVVVDGVVNGWLVPSLPDGGEISLVFVGQRYYTIAAALSIVALIVMIVLACAPALWPVRVSDR
ncbi:MAG TPA: alpha-(1-_3)-arabinofuranosyltransferase family protein [Candidatus Binatia bacterium]|nr:alpha-(1->3)-arabinofuranosyltransferase family protein [Candidatus Binatia bacterium]